MGYCSATDYVDNAIAMADAAVKKALELTALREADTELDRDQRLMIDEVMKPYVKAIADKAREDDWDCEGDSDYVGRFPQEIDPDSNFEDYHGEQARDGR